LITTQKPQEHPRNTSCANILHKRPYKKENNKETLKISVQNTIVHLLQPPPSETPKGKEMEPTHQDSEEHPRRHCCFVDLYPHPPRPTGLLSLGNIGQEEPRARPSRHATGDNQQGRWKTAASPIRNHQSRVGQASLWSLPASDAGAAPWRRWSRRSHGDEAGGQNPRERWRRRRANPPRNPRPIDPPDPWVHTASSSPTPPWRAPPQWGLS
jgi:hypothetical protein